MTKQLDEGTHVSDPAIESKLIDSSQRAPVQEPAPVRPKVQVEDPGAILCYANFCRVTGTPEELILDFGLNSQPMGLVANISIKQRLVVNYFTAKRLLQALGMSIQRHEAAFGVLETDVQKRVTPAAGRLAASV